MPNTENNDVASFIIDMGAVTSMGYFVMPMARTQAQFKMHALNILRAQATLVCLWTGDNGLPSHLILGVGLLLIGAGIRLYQSKTALDEEIAAGQQPSP